jgi:DNA repair protein RecO (recombination protein O)
MNDRVNGLVLKNSDYKENAALVSVLTREYGKLSLIVPGARKMTSKNAGAILPYTEDEFLIDYQENRTMFRLKSASLVQAFRHLHGDLTSSSAAAVLAEVTDALSLPDGEEEKNDEYGLLKRGFELLNEGRSPYLVLALFLGRTLEAAGIGPDVDECVLCGKTSVSAFSVADGGFLCEDCRAKAGLMPEKPDDLRRIRILAKASYAQFDLVDRLFSTSAGDADLFMRFFLQHSGLNIRSYALFQRLSSVERPR